MTVWQVWQIIANYCRVRSLPSNFKRARKLSQLSRVYSVLCTQWALDSLELLLDLHIFEPLPLAPGPFRVHVFHGLDLAPKCACAKVCAAAARRTNRKKLQRVPHFIKITAAWQRNAWGRVRLPAVHDYGLWAICMPKQARNGQQTTIAYCNSVCCPIRHVAAVGLSARLLASLVSLGFEPVRLGPLFGCFPSAWLLLGLKPFLITSWESSCRSRTT